MSKVAKFSKVEKKKIEAYDLLKKVYATVAGLRELQEELARLEAEIAGLEKENV